MKPEQDLPETDPSADLFGQQQAEQKQQAGRDDNRRTGRGVRVKGAI